MSKIVGGKWNFLPLLLMLFIAIVLSVDSIAFDIIGFKEGKSVAYNLSFWFFGFLPLLLLPFFDYWKSQRTHEKILLLTLAAFFIAINYKFRLAFQFSAVFALAVAFYFFRERKIYRPDTVYILLIVYVLIGAISLLWTSNLKFGLMHLRLLSPLLYVPFLFCFFRLDKKQFDLIALFMFRMMMFYAAYSVCSWIVEIRFLGLSLQEGWMAGKDAIKGVLPYDAVYGWTNHMHPTYNSVSLIFALAVGWCYVGKGDIQGKASYFELIFFVTITLLLALLTASRLMLVIWGVINFFGILHFIRDNRRLLIAFSVLPVIFVLLFGFLFYDRVSGFFDDPIRKGLNKAAFESIRENTWHGVGLGAMKENIHDKPDFVHFSTGSADVFPPYYPHNQFIGDSVQTGIFGLIAILCIIVSLFYKSLVQRNWLLGMGGSIAVLLMCVEMPLIYPNGIFFFALIFCFLVQRNFETRPIILTDRDSV